MQRDEIFSPDFDLNIEAAAFTFLMAKTEAIMEHDQDRYLGESPHSCRTAGCLVGHAAVYENGSVEDVEHLLLFQDALQALFGVERLTTGFLRIFYENVVRCFNEAQALRNFRRLIRFAATEDEWREFQRLTQLDAEKLLSSSPVEA